MLLQALPGALTGEAVAGGTASVFCISLMENLTWPPVVCHPLTSEMLTSRLKGFLHCSGAGTRMGRVLDMAQKT